MCARWGWVREHHPIWSHTRGQTIWCKICNSTTLRGGFHPKKVAKSGDGTDGTNQSQRCGVHPFQSSSRSANFFHIRAFGLDSQGLQWVATNCNLWAGMELYLPWVGMSCQRFVQNGFLNGEHDGPCDATGHPIGKAMRCKRLTLCRSIASVTMGLGDGCSVSAYRTVRNRDPRAVDLGRVWKAGRSNRTLAAVWKGGACFEPTPVRATAWCGFICGWVKTYYGHI